MADQTLVLTCRVADFDASTGVCAAPFYSAPPSSWPALSIADAQAIGRYFALLVATAFAGRVDRRARNRIG